MNDQIPVASHAPPLPSPQLAGNRLLWIGGDVLAAAVVGLMAVGFVGAAWYLLAGQAGGGADAKLVGKWEESSNGWLGLPGQPVFEFKADGTGKSFTPNFGGKVGHLGLPTSNDLRWKVDRNGPNGPVVIVAFANYWPEPNDQRAQYMVFQIVENGLAHGPMIRLKKMQ